MVEEGNNFIIERMLPKDAHKLVQDWRRHKRVTQRSYNVTNDEQRYQFLCKVIHKELTVSEAAQQFGMNYTTAKNILTLYLTEGRIEKRKRRKRDPMKSEIQTPESLHNFNSEETSIKQKEIKLSPTFWKDKITKHMV